MYCGRVMHDGPKSRYKNSCMFGCHEAQCEWRVGVRYLGRTLQRVWALLSSDEHIAKDDMLAQVEEIVRSEVEAEIARLEGSLAEDVGTIYERGIVQRIADEKDYLSRRRPAV